MADLINGLTIAVAVVQATALITTAISWVFIPAWRTNRNFAFLNMLAADVTNYILLQILKVSITPSATVGYLIVISIPNFFLEAVPFWLLTICMFVYFEEINVCNLNVTRKRIKSCLFAWVLPSVFNIIYIIVMCSLLETKAYAKAQKICFCLKVVLYILMLLVNALSYGKVMKLLVKNSSARNKEAVYNDKSKATFTFILTGLLLSLMIALMVTICVMMNDFMSQIRLVSLFTWLFGLLLATKLVVILYFLFSSPNRVFWDGCYRRKILKRSYDDDVSMEGV